VRSEPVLGAGEAAVANHRDVWGLSNASSSRSGSDSAVIGNDSLRSDAATIPAATAAAAAAASDDIWGSSADTEEASRDKAGHGFRRRSAASTAERALHVALAQTRPTALRELAAVRPSTQWDDVKGQQEAKDALLEAVEWPTRHAGVLRRMGIAPPGGVLLYGPPGCSKTMLARAVATRVGAAFLSVKGGELLSKFVGDSERAVAGLFAAARRASPCVVFLDEADALAPKRGSGGGGGGGASVRDRVVN